VIEPKGAGGPAIPAPNEVNAMKYSKEEVDEAKAKLLEWVKPGDTVYTVLRDVSRSGMSRKVSVVIFRDGKPLHPNYSVATILGYKLNKGFNDSLTVNGCGFDAGFEIVYNLGRVLWPGGVCMGAKTRKRSAHVPHSNNGPACEYGDSGYALRHEWL